MACLDLQFQNPLIPRGATSIRHHPFIGNSLTKRHLTVCHMGMYRDEELDEWSVNEYPKHMNIKLNMEKSCIRLTNPKKVPYELLGELSEKTTVEEWIELYGSCLK